MVRYRQGQRDRLFCKVPFDINSDFLKRQKKLHKVTLSQNFPGPHSKASRLSPDKIPCLQSSGLCPVHGDITPLGGTSWEPAPGRDSKDHSFMS
jgi:hypothetical protein